MEHLGDEFDAGRFVRVLLFEVHDKAECAVFKGGVCRSDDDCVPEGGSKSVMCQGKVEDSLWTHHVITLSAIGEAETPAGGSVCIR